MASISVAEYVRPVITALFGEDSAVEVRFWDGSGIGSADAKASVVFRSPNAIRRIVYSPGELGLARAYVAGDIAFEGDIFFALEHLAISPRLASLGPKSLTSAVLGVKKVGGFGKRLAPPSVEVKAAGRMHSILRDAKAISHHYDVGNDFYELFLGDTWTYSCARFTEDDMTLDEAQVAKYDLICRKLGLTEGMRYLDVGCGWGGLLMHAAQHYGVTAIGVTISKEQAAKAKERIETAGLADRVKVRIQDYRTLAGETFDAISSVGMFEHVGRSQMASYFGALASILNPGGRLLNHAIDKPGGAVMEKDGFIARYVFPDGELQDLAVSTAAMQDAGFEVRDIESMREHYAKTLRHWVGNLEKNWNEAVAIVGEERARVWHLYMAASAVRFETNTISIHQTLGVKTLANGESGMPATRHSYA